CSPGDLPAHTGGDSRPADLVLALSRRQNLFTFVPPPSPGGLDENAWLRPGRLPGRVPGRRTGRRREQRGADRRGLAGGQGGDPARVHPGVHQGRQAEGDGERHQRTTKADGTYRVEGDKLRITTRQGGTDTTPNVRIRSLTDKQLVTAWPPFR